MSGHESRETEQLETLLKSLKPARPDMDRDRLMFRAGQASSKLRSWSISTLTAVVGLLAGIGGTYLGLRSAPEPVERVVYVYLKEPAPQPPSAPSEKLPKAKQEIVQTHPPEPVGNSLPWWGSFLGPQKSAGGYVGLRDDVLRWGVDMLPESPAHGYTGSGSGPSTVGQLQADMLESIRDF